MDSKLIIYMPALNEADSIEQVIDSLPKEIQDINSIEVLVVDDGSTDDTAVLAKRAGASIVKHRINKGVGIAFQSAVSYAL